MIGFDPVAGGWLQASVILAVLGVGHVPLGDHMARVFMSTRHWRLEKLVYRLTGVDPDREQRWTQYLLALLAFSGGGVLGLYLILRLQPYLPLAIGHAAVPPALAFNIAVSFTTNTSWQSYAGEATLGHLAVAAGLGVEAFASTAVGMAAAIALIRGLSRRQTDSLGNFWVDFVRSILRVLLPLSVVAGIILAALGVVQNLDGPRNVTTLAGGEQTILGGPVASWEPIKLLSGGDGGGVFNVNSAHPFENPGALSNVIEIVLMLLIPTAFIRTFGQMVGHRRQGWALLAVAGVLFVLGLGAVSAAEHYPHNTVTTAVGAATEGTETRFGVAGSAAFGAAATSSAAGAANSAYDSFTALGGGVLMANMLLGEVSPGGTGSGLYGLLIVTMIAVFLGGLMIGRTPEFLRKRLGAREIKFISLYLLVPPLVILVGTALAVALPIGRASMLNVGPHGFSEILYAFTSATMGNGSAFAGISANTPFYNTALGIAMVLGRYLPIVFVLGLAGSLAAKGHRVVNAGTLRTHTPLFVALIVAVALILVGLEYLPALSLGPIAELR